MLECSRTHTHESWLKPTTTRESGSIAANLESPNRIELQTCGRNADLGRLTEEMSFVCEAHGVHMIHLPVSQSASLPHATCHRQSTSGNR